MKLLEYVHSSQNKHTNQSNATTGTCSVVTEHGHDVFCPRLYYETRAEK